METALHPITLFWTASKSVEAAYVSHNGKYIFMVSKNMNFGITKWDAFVNDSVKKTNTRIFNNGDKLFKTMNDAKAACTKYAENLRTVQ